MKNINNSIVKNQQNFLNPSDLSEMLRISKATLWRYVKSGKLPQPKRLSKQILLWNKNEVLEALGLAETAQRGENE